MNRSRYRRRLEADLDRWIASGLVGADRREAILTSIREENSSDRARSALAAAGVILLGLAVIAFIASNWDGMTRSLKAGILILALVGASFLSLLARERSRPRLAEALVLLAALVFAAGVGLMGQILNLPGAASSAFMLAAFGALILGVAGASPPAVALSLIFGVFWQASSMGEPLLGSFQADARLWRPADIIFPAIILSSAALSRLWNSALVRHLAIWSAGFSGGLILFKLIGDSEEGLRIWLMLQILVWSIAGFLGRRRYADGKAGGATLYGYGAWWGMLSVATFSLTLSVDTTWMGATIPITATLLERGVWIGLSLGVIVLGQMDRQGWVVGAGVASLIGAVSLLLSDLGLSLTAAAGVFLLTALIALGFAARMGRRNPDDRKG
jgi:uncharacterized membrane protein